MTIPHQDNSPLGRLTTRTTPHQDNSPLGPLPIRTVSHYNCFPSGKLPICPGGESSWWGVVLVGSRPSLSIVVTRSSGELSWCEMIRIGVIRWVNCPVGNWLVLIRCSKLSSACVYKLVLSWTLYILPCFETPMNYYTSTCLWYVVCNTHFYYDL